MTALGYRAFLTTACVALAFGAFGCTDTKNDHTTTDSTTTGSTTGASSDSEAQKNADLARQFTEEVLNKGNMQFIDDHTAPDFVEHSPSPNQEPGIAGFKKVMTEWRAAMPDLHVTADNIVAQGDMVAIHNTISGTQQGTMFGMPPHGKKMEVHGIDLVRIKDGKMTEHWGYVEEMKMMEQLGQMPPMEGMPAGGDKKMEEKKDTAGKM